MNLFLLIQQPGEPEAEPNASEVKTNLSWACLAFACSVTTPPLPFFDGWASA